MESSIPGIGDIIGPIDLGKEGNDEQRKQCSLDAWRHVQLDHLYHTLIDYYQDLGDALFTYPQKTGGRITMPLYVEDDWDRITNSKLKMTFENRKPAFSPAESQKAFWDFYNELKDNQLYDGPVFRLMDFKKVGDNLHLHFELGQFAHSVMCQYILEHETVTLLFRNETPPRDHFKIRNQVAADAVMIKAFFRRNVGRVGLNNLILLRGSQEHYIPIVQKKTRKSMLQNGLFDQISSCIFEVAKKPETDFELRHSVLREMYEELFDHPDLSKHSSHPNPFFFYKHDGIKDLLVLLQDGAAHFEVTGFCIDLVRLVPEITTLLVVNDETYFNTHHHPKDSRRMPFRLNEEFESGALFKIPRDLDDADEFLSSEMVSDPDGAPDEKGFDPTNWTLPGGFSFYQGLKRAVKNNLL